MLFKLIFQATLGLAFSLSVYGAGLVDHEASHETRMLAENLKRSAKTGFLFGQQNATSEGVGWRDKTTSHFCGDTCLVSGLHPAVYGWDFSDVFEKGEAAQNRLREKIRQAYELGGVNTISWHLLNPVTFGSPKDLTPACERIRAGADLHESFAETLDQLAHFLKKLVDKNGKSIPVILRPWHEANARWFWWGSRACSPETLKTLWQFTVERLRDRNQIHQLLYAFSPNWYPANGMRNWPGDNFVDIMGVDFYFFKQIALLQRLQFRSELLNTIALAHEKDKIAALTEVGYESLPNPYWWTEVYLHTLTSAGISREIAYAMVWRNENAVHFYAPYPGQASVPDFLEMMRDPSSLFLEDIHF